MLKSTPLVSVANLKVSFQQYDAQTQQRLWQQAVHNVHFHINQGEIVALVGESGSGKSVSAMALLNLFSPGTAQLHGQLRWNDELVAFDSARCTSKRGKDVGVIFQEPMTSLNPLHRVEKQLNEIQLLHQDISSQSASKRSLELLDWVGIVDPKLKLKAYPHEMSGGQRQRVMIAMALANQPKLLIADEPTTALDVTIQKQVIQLLLRLQKETSMAVLFISHDLNLVQKIAHRVVVMHEGNSIETNTTSALFAQPQQAYTQHLINAIPKNAPPTARPGEDVMQLKNLKVWFPIKQGFMQKVTGHVKAVQPFDFTMQKGLTYGVVGESGSGKTTLGMALLRLIQSEGQIIYKGQDISQWQRKAMRPLRRELQVVFQDPYSSLSPRMSVLQMLRECLEIHGEALGMPKERQAKRAWLEHTVTDTLKQVELDPEVRHRYPHEFSGGQRQRIAIARAIIVKPEFIVLDEPTSALDRSVQQQLIALLLKLQQDTHMTYLFISHDLSVVRAMCHYVLVMKDGEVVEQNWNQQLFEQPQHEYTQSLLEAALFTQSVEAV